MGPKLPQATVRLAGTCLVLHVWWVRVWAGSFARSVSHLPVLAYVWAVCVVFLCSSLGQEVQACLGVHASVWVATYGLTHTQIYSNQSTHRHEYVYIFINTRTVTCTHTYTDAIT